MKNRDLNLSRRDIRLLIQKAKELGYHIYTPAMQTKDKNLVGVRQPKLKRIEETKNQLAFRKELDGMKIVIYTSIDEKKRSFTQRGRIWCHIVGQHRTKGTDTLYTSYFRRVGNPLTKLRFEMEFLSNRLEYRPVGEDGKRMLLVEKPHTVFKWVSQSNENETISFYNNILTIEPQEVIDFVVTQYGRKRYYEGRRSILGVKDRERSLRKVARITRGENAIDKIQG